MLQGDGDFLRSSSRVILEEARLLEDEGARVGGGEGRGEGRGQSVSQSVRDF